MNEWSTRLKATSMAFFLVIIAVITNACGDRAVKEGVLYDTIVQGIAYSTPSFEGVTDENGRFEYRPREQVTFKLGEITLGTAEGQSQLTPLELADTTDINDAQVVNIARLLQTLDADKASESLIVITSDMRLAATVDVDLTQSVSDFEQDDAVGTLISAFGSTELISEEEALDHLQETLVELGYNQAPEVNAGEDQSVTSGGVVTISGTVNDPDGAIVDFEWQYDQGEDDPDITFFTDEEVGDTADNADNADNADETSDDDSIEFTALSERFTAPEVTTTTALTFTLTAEDDAGAEASDSVTITITP